MSAPKLVDRVAALEAEVARLKARIEEGTPTANKDWLDKFWGSFANDPICEAAMPLGREWRESFRPKPRKRKKKR